MLFDRLLKRLGQWWMDHPTQHLRSAYALLPDGAFTLEGMHYTRAGLEELLDMSELQLLLGSLAGIGDEYEDQCQRPLPSEFWSHLHVAAEQMECMEELKPYMRDGQRVRGLYLPPEQQRSARFLQTVESGRFHEMRKAGRPPVEIGVAAIEAGGGKVDTVRLLRELFGLELARAVVVFSEAQQLARKDGDTPE